MASLRTPMGPLHHGAGGMAGFDWVTVVVIVAVLAAVGGLGFGAWRLLRRRRYG